MQALTISNSRVVWLKWLCALLLALLTGITWYSVTAQAAEDDFMTVFPLNHAPGNIVVESNGRTWFTLPESNAIGSLVVTSTVDYAFTAYTIPTVNAQPYDLVYDARGAIWFTQHQGNKIGRLDVATKTFREFSIPTNNSGPTGITLDGDGNIWFGQKTANQLAKFDPQTETFSEYPYQELGMDMAIQPEDVIYQPSGCGSYGSGPGCIWSTSPTLNRVSYFFPDTETFDSIPTFLPGIGEVAEPWHGTLDGGGVLWITTRAGNRVGRYAPGTLSFWKWFTVPSANADPYGIAFQPLGNSYQFWFTENSTGRVGQLWARGSTLSTFRLQEKELPEGAPGTTSGPTGIAADSAGDVWIADTSRDRIVRWSSPYFHVRNLPVIRR